MRYNTIDQMGYYYSIDGVIRDVRKPLRGLCALYILPEIHKINDNLLIYNNNESIKPSDTFMNFIRYSRHGLIPTSLYEWNNISMKDGYVVNNYIFNDYDEAIVESMRSGNSVKLLSNCDLELYGRHIIL